MITKNTVSKGLEALARAVPQKAAAALFRRGEAIMADSKEHYVPVDLGVLRESGHVTLPEVSGNDISVTLAYGGAAKDYAIPQHERLDYKHTTGGPKYLERPVLEASKTLARDLAKDLDLKP